MPAIDRRRDVARAACLAASTAAMFLGSAVAEANLVVLDEEPAPPEASRFVVQIEDQGNFICPGTLIAPNAVLTSATCVEEQSTMDAAKRYSVRVGSTELGQGALLAVSRIATPLADNVHGTERSVSPAIFFLAEPAQGATPITLISGIQSHDLDRDLSAARGLRAFGWGIVREGKTNEASTLNPALLQVDLVAVPNDSCAALYDNRPGFSVDALCAFGRTRGHDTCRGDSGAPLLLGSPSTGFLQVGFVAWGEDCGRREFPGVYGNVAFWADWITGVLDPTLRREPR